MRAFGVALVVSVLVVVAGPAAAEDEELEPIWPELPTNGGAMAYFGQDVDVDLATGTIVAGAYGHQPARAGAAYVVEWDGDRWSLTLLQPNPPEREARAGSGVAIEGDLIAVGAPTDSRVADSAGAVYLFRRRDETWGLEEILAPPDLARDEYFGFAIDIDAGRIAVGSANAQGKPGRVFVYERRLGVWEYEVIEPHNGVAADWFGTEVYLDGDLLAVGATGVDGDAREQGGVYLYRHTAAGWELEEEIIPLDPIDRLYFGVNIDGDGRRIAVTAAGDFDVLPSLGRVYVLTPTVDGWLQEIAFAGDPAYANLGTSILIDGSTILVGALGDRRYQTQQGDLLVLIEDDSGEWRFEDVVDGPWRWVTEIGFGWSLAGSLEAYVVGAPAYRSSGFASGKVFVHGLTARCLGRPATILGTPGSDVIRATTGPDVITAGSGNDRILGVGSDDVVCSGRGWDLIEGVRPLVEDLSRRDRLLLDEHLGGSVHFD